MLIHIILLAISVGFSNFAGCIGIGIAGIARKKRVKMLVTFGFFEVFMSIIGLVIGSHVAVVVGEAGHVIAGLLLIGIGIYMIAEKLREEVKLRKQKNLSALRLFITGFALSIDNVIVGFALSLVTVPVVTASIILGGVSVFMSFLGFELGKYLGTRFQKWSEELGAAVLILVGIAVFFNLLK